MANSNVCLKARSKRPTKAITKVRDFEMVIDEPVEMRRNNDGTNPV